MSLMGQLLVHDTLILCHAGAAPKSAGALASSLQGMRNAHGLLDELHSQPGTSTHHNAPGAALGQIWARSGH